MIAPARYADPSMAREGHATVSDTAPAAVIHTLHVADRDFFARFGHMFRQLALGLNSEGVRISLLTDDAAAAADLDGTPVGCRYIEHLRGWRGWWRSRRLLTEIDPPPSLVHLWGATLLGRVGAWALEADIPVLTHVLASRDVERLARRAAQPHLFMAAGCSGFREALARRGARGGGSVPALLPALIPPRPARSTNVVEPVMGVVWTGRLDDGSGIEVLFEAVAQLRKNGCELQLALIGEGPATRNVWRDVRRRGLADCISLIDQPAFWEQALRGADALVVPTCQHELSLAPLMAMALGTVVIASRDQVADWFIEDRTVWQFTPQSPVELAFHLSRVAVRYEGVGKLTESAGVYVREHHAVSRLTLELARTYRDVLRTVREAKAQSAAGAAARRAS